MISEIFVFGKRFSVEEVQPGRLAFEEQGSINYGKAEIGLDADVSDHEKRETLLHEVLHAIDHALQLGLNEAQVGALSVGLWAFVQANPQAAAWILNLTAADS